MADYKAGDLNLTIQTISNDTIKSLDAVIERLSLIQNGLGTISGFARGRSPYIRKSTSGSRTEKTYTVGRHGKEYLTLSKDIQRAEKSLKTITTQFDRQGKVLKKTTVDVDEYGNKITKIFGGYSKGTSKGGIFGVAKLGVSLHLMRRLGRFAGELVQAGSDYNETLNLWQVAMRNNLDVADQFVNKMQKAYGISTKTLMNAQAIFKNMIGSLGNITDATAYALSEALVQMSADFASLYNVTLESAFTKMQAMLAGQVRPIRSVGGLDITEQTLFAFYQQLGGTKTMRQLNRTEKQLLSILAVYQQMGASGALGDMSKTINEFANQSRMMTEYWAELKTWTGLVLKDLIDQSGALIYINAALITMTEVVKAIAKSRGIGDENYLTGLFETTDATNDAVDELQGKLLDFDKFRSLEGASASPLAIDEKLLQAITGYSSKIDQAENEAAKLAATWTKFWIDQDGHLTKDGERVLSIIEGIVKVLGILLTIKVAAWLGHFVKGLFALKIAGQNVSTLGISVIIFALIEFADAIKNGDDALAIAMGMLAATATVFVLLNSKIGPAIKSLKNFNEALVFLGATMLIMGIAEFIHAWDDMSGVQRAIGIFGALAGAIAGAAVAIKLLGMNWAGAIGVGAMVAGTVLAVTSSVKIPNYEMGASDIDSGTVFRAGEFGKTEAVYTGSNGKTNVANVQQMKAAELQALKEWWATAKHDIPAFQGVSDSGIYTIVDGEARRRGKKFANV